jgi:hypothetical protein
LGPGNTPQPPTRHTELRPRSPYANYAPCEHLPFAQPTGRVTVDRKYGPCLKARARPTQPRIFI